MSSRFRCPAMSIRATPGIARISRATTLSASCVSSAGVSASDESAMETMGKSFGENRRMIGSSISAGSSARMAEMASRTSFEASCGSLLNSNSMASWA